MLNRTLVSQWPVSRLSRHVKFHNGKDHKLVENPEGLYPVYGSGGVFAYADDYLCDGEGVLFGRKGTIDKPVYVNGKFWNVDTMYFVEPDQNVLLPKYLYYWATQFPFDYYSTNTALPSMTQADIGSEPIALPPLSEQKRIVDELDRKLAEIDELIADAQRLESLEQERIVAERDWAFEQSETSVPLRYIAKFITSGSRDWGDYIGSVGSPFIRITNLRRDSVEPDLSNLLYVDTDRLPNDEGKRSQLQVGDILISITADLGSVAVVDENIAGGYVSQHLALVRIDTKKYDPHSIAEAILSSRVKHQIKQKSYGGTKVQLNLEDIKELSIPLTHKQLHHKHIHNQDKIINLLIEKRISLLQKINLLISR
ncbi:restriction endonuclease subunit S [Rothia nasimurium]|uniref:restriction endonuclease subunit S n=1 Tax=Rothia nasimurium TaxID=85336 RepID=UPI001F01D264|nr:restriction endonuclease subunit S [Rothia nasimurium]